MYFLISLYFIDLDYKIPENTKKIQNFLKTLRGVNKKELL